MSKEISKEIKAANEFYKSLLPAIIDFKTKIFITQQNRSRVETLFVNGDIGKGIGKENYELMLLLFHKSGFDAIEAGGNLHKLVRDFIIENTNSIKLNTQEMQSTFDEMVKKLLEE